MECDNTNLTTADIKSAFVVCMDIPTFKDANDNICIFDSDEIYFKVVEICNFMLTFNDWFVIISLLLGIPGNILSFLTIRTLPLSTASFYVALLSIADLSTLLINAIFYMMKRQKLLTVVACKLKFFFWTFASDYAHWTLVLITFERLLTVRSPLQKSSCFTLKRALISALVLGAVMVGLSAAYLLSTSFDGDLCTVDPGYKELHNVWLYVQSAVYSILPFTLLFILVTAIAVELRKIQKNRKLLTEEVCLTYGSGSSVQADAHLQEQSKTDHFITGMMFFSALVFIILTLPVCIVVIRHYAIPDQNTLETAHSLLAHTITLSISLSLHACNFFIYLLSSRRFREQLMVLIHCRPRYDKPEMTIDTSKEALKSTQK